MNRKHCQPFKIGSKILKGRQNQFCGNLFDFDIAGEQWQCCFEVTIYLSFFHHKSATTCQIDPLKSTAASQQQHKRGKIVLKSVKNFSENFALILPCM